MVRTLATGNPSCAPQAVPLTRMPRRENAVELARPEFESVSPLETGLSMSNGRQAE